MILGIGSDICDARRIAQVIERHGDRFLQRVFTPVERARAAMGVTTSSPASLLGLFLILLTVWGRA